MIYTNFAWLVQKLMLRKMGPNYDGRMGGGMEGEGVCMCTKVSYYTLISIINT